jgi:photosystem II stability/assembly factor-like uncharacterized protein
MIKRLLTLIPLSIGLMAVVFSVWAATATPIDWKIAGPFGGTATTVALDPKHPDVVLAGAFDALLFKSDNGGSYWDVLNFPKRNLSEVTSILVDPAESDHYFAGMLAAEGGGLYESHDAGKTWSVVHDIQNFGVRALTASESSPGTLVAGTLRGVMESTDDGKSWTRISDPNNLEMQGITAVAIDPKDPKVIYAGTTHLPWKTTDGGKTWESIHTGMIDDSDVFSIYVDPNAPSNVFASACSGIYASTQSGDSWRKLLGIPNTSRRTHVVRWMPANCCGESSAPGAVFAGTTTGLFRSLNRGATWRTLTNTQVNALAFVPSQPSTMYLALEYEGIGKTINGGDTIRPANTGFVDRVIGAAAVSGNKLVAIETQEGETTGIFVSGDRGESWTQINGTHGLEGVHLKAVAGSFSEDRILLAASPHQMYKSINAGLTWKAVPVRLVIPPPAEAAKPPSSTRAGTRSTTRARQTARTRAVKPKETIRDVSPSEVSGLYTLKSGTKEIVFAATDLGLLKSTDLGERWMLADIPGSTAVTALYVAPNSNGYLIARSVAGLYVSKDFGDHWTQLAFPLPASDVNDMAIPADPSAPLLAATRVGLYSSSDWGQNWYANVGGIPASTVTSVLYSSAEHVAYAVEYGHLFQSADQTLAWSEIPTNLPSLRIRQLWMPDLTSHRLYGITSNLGIIFRN